MNMSDEDSESEVEKLIPITPNTFNCMDIKCHSKDPQVKKCFKRNDLDSTVFNGLNNDYLIYKKSDSNLLKPILPVKLPASCTMQYNANRQTFVKTAPLILSPSAKLMPIKPGPHLKLEPPTLVPIRKKDDNIKEGMFLSHSTVFKI